MNKVPEKRNATAAKILDAAEAVLAEFGPQGVTARSVATRAGVNNALVFYYFGSKDHLVERVIERFYHLQLEAFAGAFESDAPLRERLHHLLDVYLDFMESHPRYPRLIQQQVAGGSTFHGVIQRHLAPLFRWVSEALEQVAPATGPTAPRHLYMSLSAIVTNYFSYAEVMTPLWGEDLLSEDALDERRAHVHWMADALLDKLMIAL